ncbi:MAG TPA: MotA/TolQ/ExbB proton channel family protein [Kofleriaceae bacterium]|nr:MotA/TolQ/ExbB proton channel family protein [Kofleriaceae bacterium]
MDQSLWEILQNSGYTMYLIVACSVLAVGVAIERAIVQWKFIDRARSLADTVNRCLARGALEEGRSACERSKSPLGDVFLAGYERLGRVKRSALEAAVNRERLRVAADLKTRMWILGTIGATAPFIGLFGTVIGVMEAFSDIKAAGSGGLSVVSGGIYEALYTTAAGIAVAVEAVFIYNFFNQRLSRIALEMKMLTDEFLELLVDQGPESGRGEKPGEESEGKAGEGEPRETQDGTREAA